MADLNPVDAMTTDYRALCAELHKELEKRCDLSHYVNTPEEDQLLDRSAAALRAALAQPTPQPPADGEVAELQRWGVDHGAQPGRPLLSPMEDGYWTPWHIAADLLQRLASDNAGLEAAAESLYWSNLSLLDSQND